MSRLGKLPVMIPSGVKVEMKGAEIHVSGPKGDISWSVHPSVSVEVGDGQVGVDARNSEKISLAMHGTARQLINNMVIGVSDGFKKTLDIVGVGYNAKIQGKDLVLQIGFCHPVVLPIPQGLTIECPVQTRVVINGVDKQLVGQFAANVRRIRPPEPYKGKGIRYEKEVVRRKQAKSFGA
ncbi:MAG TPA: 50S ribosomal protein L6 [Planctomycetes bacterium]|nr:50S ribosomal protein L6 [Planctomycetota bacterium]HIN80075.1 50S ribosomal protein L6 [Planctomycetota bacterium]